MKLAEALQERADLNRKIEDLRRRLGNVVLVQEGEEPAEDPKKLLQDLVYTASQNTSRARGTEIRVKALLKAAELQRIVDQTAKEIRELDNLLQETNWKTKLLE